MVSQPKWVLFILMTFLFITTLGAIVDGTMLAPDTGVIGSMRSNGISLGGVAKILLWNYDWLGGSWGYIKWFLGIIETVFVFYCAKEVLDYWRGRG